MAQWSKRRARLARRRSDGTFKAWPGGTSIRNLKKKENTYHGIQTHIGKQFIAQTGRRAKTGDIHRTRKADGTFHRQAMWYVKTPHGWRKSPTEFRRPTPKEIRLIISTARAGRPA